jgi:hypothetical protein
MLIEDGNRLILVTEDPVIKAKLREIDTGEIAEMPLKPLNPSSKKTNGDFDVETYRSTLNQAYDFYDMSKIMEAYCDLMKEKSSGTRIMKQKVVKEIIRRFFIDIEENGGTSDTKLDILNAQLNPFFKNTFDNILKKTSYASMSELTSCESQNVLDNIYNRVYEFALERTKP